MKILCKYRYQNRMIARDRIQKDHQLRNYRVNLMIWRWMKRVGSECNDQKRIYEKVWVKMMKRCRLNEKLKGMWRLIEVMMMMMMMMKPFFRAKLKWMNFGNFIGKRIEAKFHKCHTMVDTWTSWHLLMETIIHFDHHGWQLDNQGCWLVIRFRVCRTNTAS